MIIPVNTDVLTTEHCNTKIGNGNRKCVKEKTIRPKSRKQAKANNGFSTQIKNHKPGGGLQLAPKQKCVLVQ